jgi:hypothetical protein
MRWPTEETLLEEGLKNLAELETLPPPAPPTREPAKTEVVELVKVPFTQRQLEALDRCAASCGLSRVETLKRLVFREEVFGQTARLRVAAGVAPIY